MASRRSLLVAVLALMSLTGCVSMPSSGPVLPYRVTQGGGGSGQQYLQAYSEPPGNGWNPVQIVQGFLAANASFAGHHQVAREYLADTVARTWDPLWSARVFNADPYVRIRSGGGKSDRTAVVTVSGTVQASVTHTGAYAVPSNARGSQTIAIKLVKDGDQWRISGPPGYLLLSAVDFAADYQSRNLYFFNPARTSLVPDPVYVPLNAARSDPTDLLTGLVDDLISQPPDWLSGGAAVTAFPRGTKLQGVTLAGGTATVNLAVKSVSGAMSKVFQEVTAQLLWTLTGSGNQPTVQSVVLYVNGKPWGGSGGVPVQQQTSYKQYAPPDGGQASFYYLDTKGNVWRQSGATGKPAKVWTEPGNGPRLSDIAVSPDGEYLAGLSGGSVYVGRLGSQLQRRVTGGFTSLSWDSSDQLWLAGGLGTEMLSASGGSPVPVEVMTAGPFASAVPLPVTALRVAPDGVRVAVVLADSELSFGAIVNQQSVVNIVLSPFSVTVPRLSGMTWYGAADVIALSGSGADAVLTEYPVNGGTSLRIPTATGMTGVAASAGYPLIASSANGVLSYNESVSGTWVALDQSGQSPVYPG